MPNLSIVSAHTKGCYANTVIFGLTAKAAVPCSNHLEPGHECMMPVWCAGGQQITSMEEALAILAAAKHSKKSKKDKKQKKEKKDKKEKHAKHKHKHKN